MFSLGSAHLSCFLFCVAFSSRQMSRSICSAQRCVLLKKRRPVLWFHQSEANNVRPGTVRFLLLSISLLCFFFYSSPSNLFIFIFLFGRGFFSFDPFYFLFHVFFFIFYSFIYFSIFLYFCSLWSSSLFPDV
jgi:hypothetical protein